MQVSLKACDYGHETSRGPVLTGTLNLPYLMELTIEIMGDSDARVDKESISASIHAALEEAFIEKGLITKKKGITTTVEL